MALMTMIKYVKEYGNYTFMERPMSDVDSLVLCQFSYLKFDGMVPTLHENKPSVSMQQLAAHAQYEDLFRDVRYEKENRALFEAMAESKRFGSLKMNCFIDIIEMEWETQFSAITYLLEDGTIYVCYRGTDENLIGWKEDFNMSFLQPVPGQEYSTKYLNIVTDRFTNDFYVGGHSKGGNLAIYASMECLDDVKERIIKVYCMDGPGFRPEVLDKEEYASIADRVVKIIPHSSLVGMIFQTDENYKVIESKNFGLTQHDPYSWLIKDGEFWEVDEIHKARKFSNDTLNEWVLKQDQATLEMFGETLFKVLYASGADNLIDLGKDWKKSLNGVLKALKEIDPDTKKMVKLAVKDFIELGAKRLFDKRSKEDAGEEE